MITQTVKVPEQMQPLFERAEAVVSEYFKHRKDDPTKGTVEISGDRYVMIRAPALAIEFFDLVEGLFGRGREKEAREFALNLLFDLAHALGKSDARNFQEKMNLHEPLEKLSAGPIHFSHTGWAFVDIFPESHPSPDEEYLLIYDHPYSFESDAWKRQGRSSTFPVCIMNAGYSSGWCEESFGVTLVASEILCQARGDDCCRFIMAPPARIEEHINRYMKERPEMAMRASGYSIPDFFARKRLEEELRRHIDEIEKLNAFMADRELRMLELKREVNALLKNSGKPPRYQV